jgi:hypothetical protein
MAKTLRYCGAKSLIDRDSALNLAPEAVRSEETSQRGFAGPLIAR